MIPALVGAYMVVAAVVGGAIMAWDDKHAHSLDGSQFVEGLIWPATLLVYVGWRLGKKYL